MSGTERKKERKLTIIEAFGVAPKSPLGERIKFRKERKEDKIKKLLGDKYRGVIIRGDEIEILVDADNLSKSERLQIQKIVDGE